MFKTFSCIYLSPPGLIITLSYEGRSGFEQCFSGLSYFWLWNWKRPLYAEEPGLKPQDRAMSITPTSMTRVASTLVFISFSRKYIPPIKTPRTMLVLLMAMT